MYETETEQTAEVAPVGPGCGGYRNEQKCDGICFSDIQIKIKLPKISLPW